MNRSNYLRTPFNLDRLVPAVVLALVFALAPRMQAQSNIPGPEGSGRFGTEIYALPSGNIVITDPEYSIPNGPENVGAVYLYNGATGELISTLTGSTANDAIGHPDAGSTTGFSVVPGVVVLSNGNFLVRSLSWKDEAGQSVGAITFVNGTTGLSGEVSASNSLVGSTSSDLLGIGFNGITQLSNGNYVVNSPSWDNGATKNVGAVTFGNGTTGVSGVVSPSNSLTGAAEDDRVGSGGVTALTNGNYVVISDTGSRADGTDGKGAVTFCQGDTGTTGVVSAANSLVGSAEGDRVGGGGVRALTNGNYVVISHQWDNGAAGNAGAVTFGDGTTGISGVVSASNSLVGTQANDSVGVFGVTALTNGNYVVNSASWSNGGAQVAGAVTFANGTTGISGEISPSNSLIGSVTDRVGSGGVTALTNGNYVVSSPEWNNGAVSDAGAATFADGTTGITGGISASNSLVGSAAGDRIGGGSSTRGRVTALSNGNYVVTSPEWNNGAAQDAGAATFGNGTSGIVGAVTPGNSLVGSTAGDNVGYEATALTNGNYVIGSPQWDNGAIVDAGASTFGSGVTGITGEVSATNSLVGSTTGDEIGGTFASFVGGGTVSLVTRLTNGNYVISSPFWDNGGIANPGAITFANGTTGITGTISAANSLIGSTANDQIGFSRNSGNGNLIPTMRALPNGDYAVGSPHYDNGAIVDAGAVTYGDGEIGTVGMINAENSFLGTTANGGIGANYVFDAVNNRFVIGRVTENMVTLFSPTSGLLNISTRGRVLTGDNVLIAGIIITGSEAKKVMFRAVGNSMEVEGMLVPGRLADPTLSLHDSSGTRIAFNDDWAQAPDAERMEIQNSGLQPEDPQEPAILRTLDPGLYTAIVRGKDETTGIALVEAYDMAPAATASRLANLSTRGFVDTEDNLLIGGAIVGGTGVDTVVRGVGPSLEVDGMAVENRLLNPTLQLVDENGTVIAENDDWQSDPAQAQAISETGLQPSHPSEAAVRIQLRGGRTTMLLRGQENGTGIGLIEIFALQNP